MKATPSPGITKYQQVLNWLNDQIDKHSYLPGDKLPSIRQLSRELNLSKNTVIRAYQQLEAGGKITACPRSGYRVAAGLHSVPTVPVPEPEFVDLMTLSKTIMRLPASREVLPMGSAHPDTNFPAIRSLYAEIGRHSRYQSHIPSHYQLPPGDENLLKQLVGINRELGITTSASELLITHGAQQAISLSLQAITRPGDIVLLESASYFGNLLLLESLGLQAIEIPFDAQYGWHFGALEAALQNWPVKAILINPSFNNPTGHVMTMQERQEFLSLTGGIPIIEDDVFGGLAYHQRPLPLKTLDTENRVIYCTSLSKTLDSRLRIGWVIAGQYQPVIEKRLMTDNMGSPNLLHSAVGEFLTTGKYRDHLGKIRRSYSKKQKLFFQALSGALDRYPHLKERYHLTQPEGGYLCWLILPEPADSNRIYQEALAKGISLLPGNMFSAKDQHRHCIRFSFANYEDTPKWQQGLATLAGIIARHLAET
ncbi:aminotransferase-like domain-containing protein [Photobacterium ganghwense]|uniref:aminotransferase-like domain-containing protein n=1 Tax=Photobacterium ganghwense TaxID=320778 RepID=UPI001C2CF5C7|nr:PLP-dependent aminotransferase family protein [Photobacterium ganghwense]MBV1842091.1 PLP-dependent aminotransferase family protein [Photobacterium ganghwense]